MASHGAIAALLVTGAAEIWSLCPLAAMSGAATAFFRPASTRLVAELVSESQLLRANAMLRSAQAVGMIVGPALAGALVAAVGRLGAHGRCHELCRQRQLSGAAARAVRGAISGPVARNRSA
jgi:MFS family permease